MMKNICCSCLEVHTSTIVLGLSAGYPAYINGRRSEMQKLRTSLRLSISGVVAMCALMPEDNSSENSPPLLAKAFNSAGWIARDHVRSFALIIGVARPWRRRAAESLCRLSAPLRVAPQLCPMAALLAVTKKGLAVCSVSWNHVPDSRNFC